MHAGTCLCEVFGVGFNQLGRGCHAFQWAFLHLTPLGQPHSRAHHPLPCFSCSWNSARLWVPTHLPLSPFLWPASHPDWDLYPSMENPLQLDSGESEDGAEPQTVGEETVTRGEMGSHHGEEVSERQGHR